jgi:hypothetical protein
MCCFVFCLMTWVYKQWFGKVKMTFVLEEMTIVQ